MGRSGSSLGILAQNKNGQSETKSMPQGQPKTLEVGTNKTYLCAHICAANKKPKLAKNGNRLFQQTVTEAIRAEAEVNFGVWAYLAEVGYNMRLTPPKPLMSGKPERMHRPSTFPLGAAQKQIEEMAKGAFRIPDLTILTIKATEIIAMRNSGTIDWSRFYPEGKNIERLVEIKFGKDDWSDGQFDAYEIIAPKKVKELSDTDCSCDTRKPPNGGLKIPVYPPIKNPTPYKSAIFRPAVTVLVPKKGIPSMFGAMGKMIAPPSPQVQFYRKLVPLQEYQNLMIPITASVGLAGAFICGSVVFAEGGAGTVATAGVVEATTVIEDALLITGFSVLAR